MFDALIYVLVRPSGDTTLWSHQVAVPASLAMWAVETDQQNAGDAQAHETTDRNGHRIHVFYTRLVVTHGGADEITHIAIVPTAALTEESR